MQRQILRALVTGLFILPSLPAAAVSWQPMGTPSGALVLALTFDGQSPKTLVAGTLEQGLFHSADGGATWQAVSGELAGTTVKVLTSGPGVIYAGGDFYGLWMSLDGGTTWMPSLLDGYVIKGAATDPGHPGVVYAISDGLEKSTDAGRHWKKLASQPQGRREMVVVDGGSPNVVYVISDITSLGTRISRSMDGGATWSVLGLKLNYAPSAFVVDQVTHTAYLGTDSSFLSSTDHGATWRPVRGWPGKLGIFSLAASAGTVYAGAVDNTSPHADRGVFVSTNSGVTWKPANVNLGDVRARTLTIAPHNPKVVAAGIDGWGVFKSLSSGASWASASRGLGLMFLARIAPDPFQPGTFYAGSSSSGVWKTATAGSSWQPLHTVVSGSLVWAPYPDPRRRKVVYAGRYLGALSGTPGDLARSLDGGLTWTLLDGGLRAAGVFGSLLIDPLRPSTLYAGTLHGLYRSVNGGDTWTPGAGAECTLPQNIAIASTGTVYLAGPALEGCTGSPAGGVLASSDGGATWTFRGSLPAGQSGVLAVDPASETTLYLGYFSLYRSTDGGATWEITGLQDTFGIRSLTFGGSDLRTLYAGTDRGIPRASQDGGATWHQAGDDFPVETTAYGLTWDSQARALYAATLQGLFSLHP
jgi:photosystem II stability/assembly factor-like uncharacterized protein